MVKLMPQELEVRYLLPAIRREVAITLKNDYNMKQREVADSFGITEAAVSQYLSSKRGSELKFNSNEKLILKEYAKKINKNRKATHIYLYELSKKLKCPAHLCKLHRDIEEVPAKCSLCK